MSRRQWTVGVVVGAASAALAWASPAAAFQPLSIVGAPGGAAAGELSFPQAVAIGPNGHLYVPDNGQQRVNEFQPDGTFVRAWGWGVDTGAAALETCTTASTCQNGSAGGGPGQFNTPTGIDVDAAGNVYVADKGNHRISVFTSTGGFIRTWGADVDTGGGAGFEVCTATCKAGVSGAAAGEMFQPNSVAVSGSSVYATDSSNSRVNQYTTAGTFTRSWGWGVDTGAAAPETCTTASTCQTGIPGGGAGQFDQSNYAITGIAVGAGGHVYVASISGRVDEFDANGTFVRAWGWGVDTGALAFETCTAASTCQTALAGDGPGQMSNAAAVATGTGGNLLVAEATGFFPAANRISEFTSSGSFVRAFGFDVIPGGGTGFEICTVTCKAGVAGNGFGQLNQPLDAAVDVCGAIWTIDQGANKRLTRYGEPGTLDGPPCIPVPHTISVANEGTGSGTVTSSPAGIDCGSDCSETFANGEVVTLTATPRADSSFESWTGACASSVGTSCTLVADADASAGAVFTSNTPVEPGPYALFTAPTRVRGGELIYLDASQSNGDEFLWDFNGDDLTDVTTDPETPYLALRLHEPGETTITLTVPDDAGLTVKYSQTVTVQQGIDRLTRRSPDTVTAASSKDPLFPPYRTDSVNGCSTMNLQFGIVDAKGCMKEVIHPADIPNSERPLIDGARLWTGNFLLQNLPEVCRFDNPKCATFAQLRDFGIYVSKQAVHMNGMTLTPRNGAAILIFPGITRVASSDAVLTYDGSSLTKAITVNEGPLNMDVGTVGLRTLFSKRKGLKLFSFDAARDLPDIGGFKLDSQAELAFTQDGTRRLTEFTMRVRLPQVLKAAAGNEPTGEVTIEADNDSGIQLGRLLLKVPEAYAGSIRLSDLSFTYLRAGNQDPFCGGDWWKATARAFLLPSPGTNPTGINLAPEPQRNGIAFCQGSFHSGGAELVFGAAAPEIAPGVFLESIDFSMQLQQPVVFDGGGTISAAKIVEADGGLLAAFPTPSHPYVIRAGDANNTMALLAGRRLTSPAIAVGGNVRVVLPGQTDNEVGLGLGNGYLLYTYPDYVAAGGNVHVQTLVFAIDAGGGAEISTRTGRYNVNAQGRLCLAGGITIAGQDACIGGLAWASSIGAVACLYAPKNVFEPGVGYKWATRSFEFFLGAAGDGCKPSRYWERNVQSARALAFRSTGLQAPTDLFAGSSTARRQDQPLAFTVKNGEDTANVHLDGAGGAPAVRIEGPDGEVLESVPNQITAGEHLRVLAHDESDTTWVGVDDAQPGTYIITPLPGSVAISAMSETRPEDDTLKASVRSEGDERVVHYDVGDAKGQLVRFYERGEATWRELGKATSGEGEIRFTPAPGPSGQREIVAQIEVDGFPGPAVTVAEFEAPPPPEAGAVRKVKARRAGKKLVVSWAAADNASTYNVVVTQSDGVQRTVHTSGRRTKARIRGISETERGMVRVAAVGPLADVGRAGSGRFKATKREKDRLLQF